MGLPQRLCHDAQTAGWPHTRPMNRSFALLTAAALLSGCQTFAPSAPDGTPPVEEPAAVATPAQPQVYRAFSQETLLALLTVFTSRELWALWNGLGAYLCMGLLFAGEWLWRRRVRRSARATPEGDA